MAEGSKTADDHPVVGNDEILEIARNLRSLANEIPNAGQQSDDKTIEIFQIGWKKDKNIRLMVVGMYGVGKSLLVNNLIKDLPKIKDLLIVFNENSILLQQLEFHFFILRDKNIIPPSTEGIDLHICKVMEDGDWCIDKEYKSQKYMKMLENACNKTDDFVQMVSPLVEAIQNDTNNKPSSDTHVSLEKAEKEITVFVWDFAGQTLYYSTHQLFLNQMSTYLVLSY
ncbi:hypothetical protein DPMN_051480 [Dreissena polymorpha]|uniref:Uncharacterized protein n=1 Tax=Dreissena polymorpha TaxID=45954 RepID=A0A9D4CJE3_DREPO|nr:hypothetical protein DPMN_051480 [Dreissena polymorpha]